MKTTPPSHLTRTLLPIERLEDRIAPAVVIGLDVQDRLVSFDTATPGTVSAPIPVTGLQPGETLLGIDFRPATGELFGLGDSNRLYLINPQNGAATAVNLAEFTPSLEGDSFGFDFNPTVDRLRVVSDADQNLRLNPVTGAVVDSDPNTAGTQADGDLNYGGPNPDPNVVGSAYTNNFAAATATTLYGIDSALDALVIQSPPNAGGLTVVGPLGVDTNERVGFDILSRASGDLAFASLTVGGESALYQINLATGAATLVGDIGGAANLKGIAIQGPTLNQVDARTYTYTDVDGDLVTIKINQGTLTAANVQLIESGQGFQLRALNLTDPQFSGTKVKITATPGSLGDGFVNVGAINATGNDLGKVIIDGDLGQIDVGTPAPGLPAFTLLTVHSLGRFGTSTQGPGGDGTSTINGAAGPIFVATDLVGFVNITGIGAALDSMVVGGSLVGDTDFGRGSVSVAGNIGKIKVFGDVRGGALDNSGEIFSSGTITKVRVLGSVFGGTGAESGHIEGQLAITKVRISGDVIGSTDDDADASGSIESRGPIGAVIIDGNLVGGATRYSGSIYTGSGPGGNAGTIGAVFIGGSLVGGSHELTGIISDSTIGDVTVGGSVRGTDDATVKIIAQGRIGAFTTDQARAIASITINGSIEDGQILAGYNPTGFPTNADVQVGRVKVIGDWIASDLVAGIRSTDAFFGDDAGTTNNNSVIAGNNSPAIPSVLAKIVVGGQVIGTPGVPGDSYGFVAERIGAFKVNGNTFPLSPTAADNFTVGSSGDVRVREYVSFV